jgi:hypothetical protein
VLYFRCSLVTSSFPRVVQLLLDICPSSLSQLFGDKTPDRIKHRLVLATSGY